MWRFCIAVSGVGVCYWRFRGVRVGYWKLKCKGWVLEAQV